MGKCAAVEGRPIADIADASEAVKVCARCKIAKSLDEFAFIRRQGRHKTTCYDCRKLRSGDWYKEQRRKIQNGTRPVPTEEEIKSLRVTCRHCGLEKAGDQFCRHLGMPTTTCRQCKNNKWPTKYNRTPEEIERARKKLEQNRWLRKNNPEEYRRRGREHAKAQREREKAAGRPHYSTRRFFFYRSRRLSGQDHATPEELALLWIRQRGKCALTGRKLIGGQNAHLDHIIPKAAGGTDAIDNLRWLCKHANLAKNTQTDEELVQLCREVISYHEEQKAKVASHSQVSCVP